MAAPAVVACTNCGKKNRVAVIARGVPRCAVCHTSLPWIVDADAADFDAQSIPLLALFANGEELDRLVGSVPERQLRRWLEPHLSASRA